jgi:hypothetical protein
MWAYSALFKQLHKVNNRLFGRKFAQFCHPVLYMYVGRESSRLGTVKVEIYWTFFRPKESARIPSKNDVQEKQF